MEKFREIEVDLQNRINEIIGIDTLFDDYVKERNEYGKDLFNSLINNNAKLSNKINKAIEYIGNGNIGIPKKTREKFIKILKGEYDENKTN